MDQSSARRRRVVATTAGSHLVEDGLNDGELADIAARARMRRLGIFPVQALSHDSFPGWHLSPPLVSSLDSHDASRRSRATSTLQRFFRVFFPTTAANE
jgi:hypothetical protein